MAYQAQLINRQAQFGTVSYDVLVTDGAALLPAQRMMVSWPTGGDTTSAKNAVIAAAPTTALNLLRDAEILANYQQALIQGGLTFQYSTVAQNIAYLRSIFANISGWDCIRLAKFIIGLGLTDAQYTNFFGYSGGALTTFKNKLATAAANYDTVSNTQGG